MDKIVILAGSVRKGGNTDKLVEAFANGAKQKHEVKIISVADHKVNPCIGCNTCFTREDKSCFQKDDMQKIYKELEEADVIVIASPVYFYGISAQLKCVIDRLHTPYRKRFKVKRLGLLLVAGATLPTVFDSIKLQYKQVLDYFQLEDGGMVLAGGVREKGDIDKMEVLEEAYQLGMRI